MHEITSPGSSTQSLPEGNGVLLNTETWYVEAFLARPLRLPGAGGGSCIALVLGVNERRRLWLCTADIRIV
jgi:hypothetical protein